MKLLFNKYISKLTLCGLLIMTLGACESFLDFNTDPNNPTAAPPDLILSAAEASIAFGMGNEMERATSPLVQHISGTNNQILTYDAYGMGPGSFGNSWRFQFYAGSLEDFDNIDQLGAQEGFEGYSGIGKIMKAYIFGIVTDLWGDIPYTEALQGAEGVLEPAFDTQESIYTGPNSIFVMIDAGITNINNHLADPNAVNINGDLIFGGDLNLWLKAANTLKLKHYLNLRLRDPNGATAAINALIAENNFIGSNAEDFEFPFSSEATNENPRYDFAYNNRTGDITISTTLADTMQGNNDPRVNVFFNDRGLGVINAFGNNAGGTPPNNADRALYGEYVIGDEGDGPGKFLTYFQTQYMLAEATLTLGTTGDARAYYAEALQASMDKAGVDGATYIANRLAAYDAAATNDDKLVEVIFDKWVAQFGMGIETYTDFRRTGLPALTPAPNNISPDGEIPKRMPIPELEINANPNAPRQAPLISTPVWWMNQ